MHSINATLLVKKLTKRWNSNDFVQWSCPNRYLKRNSFLVFNLLLPQKKKTRGTITWIWNFHPLRISNDLPWISSFSKCTCSWRSLQIINTQNTKLSCSTTFRVNIVSQCNLKGWVLQSITYAVGLVLKCH